MAWEKSVSQKDAVKAFMVVGESGKSDLEASVEKFRVAATRLIVNQETEDAIILNALENLFDKYRGARLNVSFIRSQTVEQMKKNVPELTDPNLFTMMANRVEEVLDANTNQPAVEAKGDKPAVEEITGRLYAVKRGKNGGHYRISDQAPAK